MVFSESGFGRQASHACVRCVDVSGASAWRRRRACGAREEILLVAVRALQAAGKPVDRLPARLRAAGHARSRKAAISASARTMPLALRASGPSSNCGLISASRAAPATARAARWPSSPTVEMNDRSTTISPNRLRRCLVRRARPGETSRTCVFSKQVTRASAARRASSWPWPTSMPITRRGAVMQQAVGEAAGGHADVQRGEPAGSRCRRGQRVLELGAAARCVARFGRSLDAQLLIRRTPAASARLTVSACPPTTTSTAPASISRCASARERTTPRLTSATSARTASVHRACPSTASDLVMVAGPQLWPKPAAGLADQ